MKAGIVGYGTAGQAAALFFARDGHAVEVFERSAELRPAGAGLLLQPTGLGVLAALGLDAAALAHGARIGRLHGQNRAGRTGIDMRYADFAATSFGLGMTRGVLFSLLHEHCREVATVRTGMRIDAVDADGRPHGPYDLVVVADGSHSTLRAGSGLHHRAPLYPWGAMWCLLPADDWPHAAELRQRCDGTRTLVGALPVGRLPGHGDRRWLTYYYGLPDAAVDAFDAAALECMQRDVAALWPELAERTRGLADPAQLNRARYRDVRLARPWRGHLAWIGDSAHGMSPQLGQGVNMALLDAQALAAALAEHAGPLRALPEYARRRAGHVAIYRFPSRWLTPLFQSDSRVLAPLRDACFGTARPTAAGSRTDAEDPRGQQARMVALNRHRHFTGPRRRSGAPPRPSTDGTTIRTMPDFARLPMKRLIPFLFTLLLLATGLLGGCATAPAQAPDSGRVRVDWTDPQRFADVRENPAPSPASRNPEEWLQSLARWLRGRADSMLAPGERLQVTFTDIKRAGSYEPWRGPQWMDVRIIKDIYPPRIDLRFTLTDANGTMLAEGERNLKDIAFLRRGTLENDDPLRYEKRLLDDWLRKEFRERAKR